MNCSVRTCDAAFIGKQRHGLLELADWHASARLFVHARRDERQTRAAQLSAIGEGALMIRLKTGVLRCLSQ